ncbi:BlaI/MecI/CopY family transcriptional regulator [Nonomuraea sp. NPDC049309]|uniref:BlaI/MecI/CopY family transcriptional regulator n=1 Tax=Nonomuraea sp. NPDC049309 TaxID=3364350 RepID=UPI003710A205
MSRFSGVEEAVLNRLWEWGRPADAQELLETVRRDSSATRAVLNQALDTLHRAGLLDRERVDGRDVFSPTVSQVALKDLLMSQVLGTARSPVGYAVTCVKHIAPTESVPP